MPETLSEFSDPNCEMGTIAGGAGSKALAPGQFTTYTCSQPLTAVGPYTNTACVSARTVGGGPLSQCSNQVEVTASEVTTLVPVPSLSITKLQEIAGGTGTFTTAPIEGWVGQTIEYEIVVKNTGNVALGSLSLSDPQCDPGTLKGGKSSLSPGEEATYTCSHLIVAAGVYTNVAGVEATPPGGKQPLKEESKIVEAKAIEPVIAYKIEKLQHIAGTAGSFTAAPLEGAVGDTIEYEIVVTNEGNQPLSLGTLGDSHCETGTVKGPTEATLAPGEKGSYTCTRPTITAPGTYENVGTVPINGPGEAPTLAQSQKVEVKVPPGETKKELKESPFESKVETKSEPKPTPKSEEPTSGVLARCEISPPTLKGVSGPKSGTFTATVSALGIARVTFYLDGHKLRTLTQSQARHGLFSIKINAARLSHGPHKVSFETVAENSVCGTSAAVHTFVRPFTARRAPRFTG